MGFTGVWMCVPCLVVVCEVVCVQERVCLPNKQHHTGGSECSVSTGVQLTILGNFAAALPELTLLLRPKPAVATEA
jgi:hypothetical protein